MWQWGVRVREGEGGRVREGGREGVAVGCEGEGG